MKQTRIEGMDYAKPLQFQRRGPAVPWGTLAVAALLAAFCIALVAHSMPVCR